MRTRSQKRGRPWIDANAMKVGSQYQIPTDEEREERYRAEIDARCALAKTDGDRWKIGAMRVGAINVIYFAQSGQSDAYKIGYAGLWSLRRPQLQIASPVPINLRAWVSLYHPSGLLKAEQRMQELAAMVGNHMHGEWYQIQDGLTDQIIDKFLADSKAEDIMGVSYLGEWA